MLTYCEVMNPVGGGSIGHGDAATRTTTFVIRESSTVSTSDTESITSSTTIEKSLDDHHKPTFTPFIAFCFTLNYVVGTGFLTIPWAFVQSGLILSSIIMILSAVLSDIAKDYLLEAMARAEVMLDDQMRWIDNRTTAASSNKTMTMELDDENMEMGHSNFSNKTIGLVKNEKFPLLSNHHQDITITLQSNYDSTSELVKAVPSSKADVIAVTTSEELYMVAHQRKFEVNALCRIFLGPYGVQLYTIVLCLLLCGALAAFTNVFASAMSEALPIVTNHDNYLYYIGIFGLIVIPMSCMELHEQITVQVGMTICRFLMLFLMITTSSHCAQMMNDSIYPDHDIVMTDATSSPPSINVYGLHKTLPVLVLASIYHHAIPGLAHPVIDKTKLGNVIFRSTTICTAVAYTLLGVVVGSAFNNSIEQSSNLNWKYCSDSWYMRGISYFIILFPVLDVLSAFPLNAITLGNNMFGAYYGHRIHEVENNRSLRIAFRLLASIPPLILGMFVRELGVITDYAGTSGFILGLTIPGLLYIKSTKLAQRKNFVSWTYYTSYGCNNNIATFVTWLGVIMVIIVIVSLLLAQ